MTAARPRRSLFLAVLGACAWAGATLLLIWIGGFCAFMIYVWSLRPAPPTVKTDAIVVLTGGPQRIDTGLDLLRDGAADKLFISGVDQRVTVDALAALWGGPRARIDCCVTLGHQAQNTTQNASEVHNWVERTQIKSVRLVTAGYHTPRAQLEFKHAMPGLRVALHPIVAPDSEREQAWFWTLGFREYNKTLLAAWRVYLPLNPRDGLPWQK